MANEMFTKIIFLKKRLREEGMKEIYESGNKSIIDIYEKNTNKTTFNNRVVDRFNTENVSKRPEPIKEIKFVALPFKTNTGINGILENNPNSQNDCNSISSKGNKNNSQPIINCNLTSEHNSDNLSLNENENLPGKIFISNKNSTNTTQINSDIVNVSAQTSKNLKTKAPENNNPINNLTSNKIEVNYKNKISNIKPYNLNEVTLIDIEFDSKNRNKNMNKINHEIFNHTNEAMSNYNISSSNLNARSNLLNLNQAPKKNELLPTKVINDIDSDLSLINTLYNKKQTEKKTNVKNKQGGTNAKIEVPNVNNNLKESSKAEKENEIFNLNSEKKTENLQDNIVNPNTSSDDIFSDNKVKVSPILEEEKSFKNNEDKLFEENNDPYNDEDIFNSDYDNSLYKSPEMDDKNDCMSPNNKLTSNELINFNDNYNFIDTTQIKNEINKPINKKIENILNNKNNNNNNFNNKNSSNFNFNDINYKNNKIPTLKNLNERSNENINSSRKNIPIKNDGDIFDDNNNKNLNINNNFIKNYPIRTSTEKETPGQKDLKINTNLTNENYPLTELNKKNSINSCVNILLFNFKG